MNNTKQLGKGNEAKLLLTKVENTKDYFKLLPDELILHIFKFLPNFDALLNYCPLVCKTWKRLSLNPSLWRSVCLENKIINVDKVEKLISFGISRLKLTRCKIKNSENELHLNEQQHLDDEQPLNVKEQLNKIKEQNIINCNNLQYLYLYVSEISVPSLLNLLSNFLNLKEINICWQEINDSICQCIAKNENLITVDLEACFGRHLTALGMCEIFRRCRNIRNVYFPMKRFSEKDVNYILEAISDSSAINFMCLSLRSVLDKHVKQIARRCPNLIKLDLMFCKNLTTSSIKFIINGLPKLQYLLLDCNNFIPPKTFLQLRSLRNLTNLEIHLEFDQPSFPKEIKDELEKALIHVKVGKWQLIK